MSPFGQPVATVLPDQHAGLVPLSLLPVEDLPQAIAARRQAGALDQADMVRAALRGLAWYCRQRDGRGLAAFVNAMAEAAPSDKPMSGPAVTAGYVPNPADPDDCLLVVIGEDGYPVTDGNGKTMAYSVKGLQSVAVWPLADKPDSRALRQLH